MKLLFLVAGIILIAVGCKSTVDKRNKIAPQILKVREDKKDSFFPVTSFIKGQLLGLDSIQVTPLHLIVINKKIDSVWIKKNKLALFLKPFIETEISETNLISFFKEIAFTDLTLNAVTFTYEPVKILPDSIPLRHWDVYIDPESGKVTKVYMVKQLKDKGVLYTQQLTWKTDNWALIVTIKNNPDGSAELLKEDKYIWNFN